MASEKGQDSHFTVIIKLPFPRGDFVDPPPVDWNTEKERALWDVLSRASKGHDIDWKALADNFDVTLPFLLQQAAWLYERQLSQVRAQMRKVGTTAHSASPSPTPGSVSGSAMGEQAVKKGAGSRVPSRLSTRQKDAAVVKNEGSVLGTPVRPKANPMSRTPSYNATAHSRHMIVPRVSTIHQKQPSRESNLRQSYQASDKAKPESSKAPNPEQSSSSESELESEPEQPQTRVQHVFKRAARFSSTRTPSKPIESSDSLHQDDDDEDEDDETPAFLPLSNPKRVDSTPFSDPSATLRLQPGRTSTQQRQQPSPKPPHKPDPSSSASSGSLPARPTSAPRSRPEATRTISRPTGPLSPHRQAELSKLSPRRRAAGGREGSDGTPSMGSSFSDLDDASVTQSALEEALLSNIQHAGMTSRMSSISQALRSRYL